MGKYYTIIGNSLYIYVTGNDLLLDLKLFPKDLHLFDSESSWRMTDKIAVVNGIRDSDIAKAEIILSMSAYKVLSQPDHVLETYFTTSEESVFDKGELPDEEDEFVIKEIQKDFEVIIPEARPPTINYSKIIEDANQPELPAPTVDEDIILEKVLKKIEEKLGKQDRVRIVEQKSQQSMIPIKAFEETIELFNKMLQKISTTPDTVSRVETSLGALNLKLSEYVSDSLKIQEKQFEAWNNSLDRLTGILTENMKLKEPESDDVSELEKKIDEFLGISEPRKLTIKVTQPDLVIEKINPLDGIIASLLNKNESVQPAPKTSVIPIELQTVERVELDNQQVTQNLEETFRYIAYSKYFPEIEQRSSEAIEYLESSWTLIESIVLKIAENPQIVDLESLSKIDRMTPEEARNMTEELEGLKGKIMDMDTSLTIKLEELLQRLEKKQAEKPRKSSYDISQNRMLKKGLQDIQEKTDSLLNHLEYNTHYIRKALKFSDYVTMESLAQSLLDNRVRLQKVQKIKEDILNILSQDSFEFLSEVETDWDILESATLDSTYNLFHEYVENYSNNSNVAYEFYTSEIPKNHNSLYQTWCFAKIIEESIHAGYCILDDNMMKITENLNVVHDSKSFISLTRDEQQLRIYYNDSDPRIIILETLENKKINNTISFQPSLEKNDSLKPLKGVTLLVPYDGKKLSGVIRLVPGGSSYNLKENLGSLL